jgi:hypothetical protein
MSLATQQDEARRHREARAARDLEDAEVRLVEMVTGALPACVRPCWVPVTELPWLEELRARHDEAAARVGPALRLVPGVLADLEAEHAAEAEHRFVVARERQKALLSGGVLPARPVSTVADAAGRLDAAWNVVAGEIDVTAKVALDVSRALASHADEVDRTYGAHAALSALVVAPMGARVPVGLWCREFAAPSMTLTLQLDHARSSVLSTSRRGFDPEWLRKAVEARARGMAV